MLVCHRLYWCLRLSRDWVRRWELARQDTMCGGRQHRRARCAVVQEGHMMAQVSVPRSGYTRVGPALLRCRTVRQCLGMHLFLEQHDRLEDTT